MLISELDEIAPKDSLTSEVEDICRRVYMLEEMENRSKNSPQPLEHAELERMIKEQWNVLDVETKLLYFDGTDVNTSKSRVSGRKIKVGKVNFMGNGNYPMCPGALSSAPDERAGEHQESCFEKTGFRIGHGKEKNEFLGYFLDDSTGQRRRLSDNLGRRP